MAKLSNINGKFAVEDTGAIRFSDQTGTTGQILKSNGNSAPTWVDPNTVGTGPWLPLAGGIVSGATTFQSSLTVGGILTGTSATFSGIITANSSSSGDYVRLYGSSGTGKWDIYGNGANLRISDNESAGILAVDRGATFGGNVDVTGSIIARVNANYYSTKNYLGDTWEFASDTADGVTFKITGGAANTTGNFFRFQTQSGGATADTKLIIDKSGNVGIGAVSPQERLHVVGLDGSVPLSSYYGSLVVDNNGEAAMSIIGNSYSSIYFGDAATNFAGGVIYEHSSNSMNFRTNGNSEKMRIDSSGDVTIQTSGADDIKNLTINSSNGSSQVAGFVIQNDGANGYIHFKAGAGNATPTTKLTIGNAANSGNVGIGTTTPYSSLSVIDNNSFGYFSSTSAYRTATFQGSGSTSIVVAANGNSNGVYSELRLGNTQATYANYSPYVRATQGNGIDSYSLEFGTSSGGVASTVMYIGGATGTVKGNVGIGTTTPVFKLDIRTSTPGDRAVLGVNSATSGTNYGGQFNSQGSGATKNIGLYATAEGATTNYAAIFDSGSVGIGTTSPAEKLHLSGGNIRLDSTVAGANGILMIYDSSTTQSGQIYGSAGDLKIYSPADVLFNQGGNVGIGNAAPTQPLDVSGYSICDKQFQRDNSTTIILGTPRILNIPYRGSTGTYDFNPVTLFGNQPQGGQCEIQVTGWQNKVNNGFIYWRDNGSNTNIGNGIVGFVQTAVVGSGVISVSTNAGGNVITITFTGWHSNGHGWNAKIISNNS